MQNKIKKVWNAVTTVLISLMVVLAVLLWGFKLLGFDIFVVQSGSMEPAYHVGSLVYVKPADAAKLKAGDVITFELGGGVRGTHRIIEVLEEDNSLSFRTKGDNNDHEDFNPVLPEDIVGKVSFSIPYLGFLITYVQQPPGTYITVCIVAVLLLLTILPDILFPEEKENKKQEETK